VRCALLACWCLVSCLALILALVLVLSCVVLRCVVLCCLVLSCVVLSSASLGPTVGSYSSFVGKVYIYLSETLSSFPLNRLN
jgi:hypothetical protein